MCTIMLNFKRLTKRNKNQNVIQLKKSASFWPEIYTNKYYFFENESFHENEFKWNAALAETLYFQNLHEEKLVPNPVSCKRTLQALHVVYML